ncbi:MAG: amidohydrolase family protein [Xanthobacteraceae bacterium]
MIAGACASPMGTHGADPSGDCAGRRAEKRTPDDRAGPDPDTRIPAFTLPRGAIDTHTHIFGPASKYPFAADRTYSAPEAPLPMFRDVHATIGCDRAVIVNATIHGTDNRVVTDAIAAYPEQYKGLAVVADTISDSELDALNKAGMRGCRFAFLKRLGGVKDMAAFTRLAHRAAEIGWHIDVYLDPGSVPDFAPILTALPTSYAIDHMGTTQAVKGLDDPGFQALLDLQRRDQKCWVKITGLESASAAGKPFHDAVPFAKALVDNAPDRVLWGTDWPHPNVKIMPNDGEIVDLIPLYAPDAAVRRKLLIDNPTRFFDGLSFRPGFAGSLEFQICPRRRSISGCWPERELPRAITRPATSFSTKAMPRVNCSSSRAAKWKSASATAPSNRCRNTASSAKWL